MNNTNEPNYFNIFQQIVGCALVAGGMHRLAIKSWELGILIINHQKYLKMDLNKKYKLQPLKADPSIKQLALLDLVCHINKETFKSHLSYYNGTQKKAYTVSWFGPCKEFEAQVVEDGKKIKLLCKPHYLNCIYMTSTLLGNMKGFDKANKLSLTAIGYGQVQYIPASKSFLYQIQALTTSRFETDQIWTRCLFEAHIKIFFLTGLFLASGVSIIQQQAEEFKAYIQNIKSFLKPYLQRIQIF